MRKKILILAAIMTMMCSFLYLYNTFNIQNKKDKEKEKITQLEKPDEDRKNVNQDESKDTDDADRSSPSPDTQEIIDVHSSYIENELMELGEFNFIQNFIKSDNIPIFEYKDQVYFRGLGGNLVSYNGKETEVILNEAISNFSQNDQFLTCLLEAQDKIVLLDLENKHYKTFEYTLSFDSEKCFLKCLYHISNDYHQVWNLMDRDFLYMLENGVLTKVISDVSNVDYPFAAYFEIEDSLYRLYNRDASCDLYENKTLIDSSIADLQVVGSDIYYLKNRNEYGGYLVENYLMKYDVHSKEITTLVDMPVISFLATDAGIYYSLDPTCFKEKPVSVENAEELRMKDNQGVYYLSNEGEKTKISNNLYSGFQHCQYGLMAITPKEDTLELHLISDEIVVLDKVNATAQNGRIQQRWKYNEKF